jgi:hypothetical protein
VQDELNQIEVACADELKKIKDEQDVIDGRIKAMDDMKSTVAEAVYLRVRADYKAKRDGLDTQASPLREKAREQYLKLSALLSNLETSQETMQLDKQEVELRHQLGEYDKTEFGKRMKAIETAGAEQTVLFDKARALRERFLAGVRSEDELRSGHAPPPPVPAAPPRNPAVTDPGGATNPGLDTNPGGAYVTGQMPAAAPRAEVTAEIAKPPAAPPAAPATPATVEGTMVMPALNVGSAAKPVVTEATVMFKPARLVPQNPEAGKATLALTLKPVGIGSDAGNEVRIGGPGVESKHAQIVPTPKGYSLVDLDTKHGTRVNAEKVKERVLNNEDVVQIGAARFVFRSA